VSNFVGRGFSFKAGKFLLKTRSNCGSTMIEFITVITMIGIVFAYFFCLLNLFLDSQHIQHAIFKALRESSLEFNAAENKLIPKKMLKEKIRKYTIKNSSDLSIEIIENNENKISILASLRSKYFFVSNFRRVITFYR